MIRQKQQRGQAVVMVAFMALGLIAATGIAADAGMMYWQRTKMQAAADAAALAGAHGLLGGNASATAEAQRLAEANGYKLDARDVSFPPGSRIRVAIHGKSPMLLGSLLHSDDPEVGASSGGELHCVSTTAGVRPWGVPDTAFEAGREYTLKPGPGGSIRGNFFALAIDANGASAYATAIAAGSKADVSVGQWLATEPGDVNGPTANAVSQLIGRDQTSYNQAVLTPDKAVRVVTVLLLDTHSVARMAGKSEKVLVSGFARFYITYATSRGEVYGRFIDRVASGTVAGTAAQYAVRLVE